MKSAARGPWMWLGEIFPGLRGNDEMYPISLKPRTESPSGGLPDSERTRGATLSQRSTDNQAISLDGPWRYCSTADDDAFARTATPDGDWPVMTLPNNWYLGGLEHAGVVWFRRRFRLPSGFAGRRLRLRFDGVDYFARVYLNGKLLGDHEGYFQPFEFDITSAAIPDGDNILAVRVNSPEEEWGRVWHMRKTLIKGIFGHHDCRPGGGWGPRGQAHNTGGIWNNVSVHADPSVRITRGHVVSTPSDDHLEAQVTAEITISSARDRRVTASLDVLVRPQNFRPEAGEQPEVLLQTSVTVPPGVSTVQLHGVLAKPRLWWTWDHGDPSLYAASITLKEGGESDRTQTVFGVRTIEVDAGWNWKLNGRRIFLRGSNYIPTQWLGEMDTAQYRRDVELMRDANLNIIRVHAHVNREEFYRETDAAGIMVWQDFALQWGYDDSPAFANKAVGQALDMVRLLGQHPSIVTWCCHNESPWDAPWLQHKVPDYDPDQNKLLDRMLSDAVRAADPTRFVHMNSGTGDGHPYPGWFHSKSFYDFRELPDAPFVTEFGAQALPDLETLRRSMPDDALWPPDWDRWEFHDFQKMETFEIAGVALGDSLYEFIENSQEYQARLIQFAIENYRRAKWAPMTGLFHFMLVDCWPGITWAVLDYYRTPKRGYDALRRAMQPVLPSIAADAHTFEAGKPFSVGLTVVNDLPRDFPGARLTWAIVGRGCGPFEGSAVVDIPADSTVPVTKLEASNALAKGDYCLEVQLEDADGRLLGANEFTFSIVPAPKAAASRQ